MTAVSKQTLYDYFCSGGSASNSISTLESELEDLIDTFYGTWTDYSSTSTIVGWSSYTVKNIYYLEKPPLVFVQFNINGTSNDTATSFTLPHSQTSEIILGGTIRAVDNSALQWGRLELAASGSTVYFYKDVAGNSWTNSGTKQVIGQFWYVKE